MGRKVRNPRAVGSIEAVLRKATDDETVCKRWTQAEPTTRIAAICAPPGTRTPNPLIPMKALLWMLVYYGNCGVTWVYARLGIEVRCRRSAACRIERCGINRGIVPSLAQALLEAAAALDMIVF